MAIELVQHDLAHRLALQLYDYAHAVAIGFIAQVGNALDHLLAHQFGHALDHPGLVHLEGNFGDDDCLAILADLLDGTASAHGNAAAPGVKGFPDPGLAQDDAAGGEIRPQHMLHQPVDGDLGVIDIGDAGVHHLAQIMGRDVGRHAHGNAAGPVDQQIGEAGRQDRRFLRRIVIVGLEIDCVFVDIVQKGIGRPVEARFGIAHGRRGIAVHGAEIALAIHQHQPHGEILGHADHGIVDRRIAMGVVFAHDVAHGARRLAVGAVPVVPGLLHRVENPAMDGLQAVAHIGQRAGHDHAHRVIEVGAFHLLFDGDRRDIGRRCDGRVGQVKYANIFKRLSGR